MKTKTLLYLVAMASMLLLSLCYSQNALAVTIFPADPPAIDPAYAASYSVVDLGPLPVAGEIGGLTFKDADTLYVDVNTYSAAAEIDAITVTRGTGQHITGFSGTAIKVANAPYMDGGLQFGPNGVLFYTAFPVNQFGQLKPGSTNPDKVIDLGLYGVPSSVGSLAFVPPGFGGVGGLKVISWDAKTWYSTHLTPDGFGTFTPDPVASPATPLPATNWEGIAFIPAGQPLFPVNSVLINADLQSQVYAFEVDANGNPKINTQKHFMYLSDAVGTTVDPVTGDVLISTEQGPFTKHVAIVRGFTAAAPHPAAALIPSSPNFHNDQSIVVEFSGASGLATEWIGLYPVGAANSAYLQRLNTDGTAIGANGIITGSVNFPVGLHGSGKYEARLFFDNSYGVEATTAFSVHTGRPDVATNPNPASASIGTGLNPTLTWNAGIGAESHGVYLGTNPNLGPGDLRATQAGASYTPGTLTSQTTYYWRIDEGSIEGTTTGVTWSFTTASSVNAPTIATSKGGYGPSETIVANFAHGTGNSAEWIGLYSAGAPANAYLRWLRTDGTQIGTPGLSSGSVRFAPGLTTAGNYEARLFSSDNYALEATTAFTIQSTRPPTVTTVSGTYNQGQAITVNFSNASGASRDWIGLFAPGSPNTAFLQWIFTDGTQTGSPGPVNGAVTFPNGLLNSGNYEVRLFFNDSYLMQAAGTFTVQASLPGAATNPNPAAGFTGAPLNPTLTWTAGSAASSHQIYFGTNPTLGPADLRATQSGTSYSPGVLATQTTYYWRVDEVNSQGTTTGAVWSFTTGSNVPSVTTNKSVYNRGEAIVVTFSNASGHASDWVGLFSAGAPNTAYLQWLFTNGNQTGANGITNGTITFPNGFSNPGNYEARFFFNGTYNLEASVSFSVQSDPTATNPNPAHNSTGVNLQPALSWTAGAGATSHQVFFGITQNLGASDLQATQAATTFSPGTLSLHTTYYWRIDEVSGQTTTTGTVWSFTTANAATTPTIAVSKGAYARNEPIVATFGNAGGNSTDWVGLYAVGAANTSYLGWLFTDGTQVGTAGLVNGTLSFSGGLPNPGNYEARLFFSNNYTVKANTTFTVQ